MLQPADRPRSAWGAADAPVPALSSEDLRLLARVAHFAAQEGRTGAASAIFDALRLMRPDHALPLIGLAICRMNEGRPDEAVRMIQSASPMPPDPEGELAVFFGQALLESGRTLQGQRVLEGVISHLDPDSRAHGMAALLLRSCNALPRTIQSIP